MTAVQKGASISASTTLKCISFLTLTRALCDYYALIYYYFLSPPPRGDRRLDLVTYRQGAISFEGPELGD